MAPNSDSDKLSMLIMDDTQRNHPNESVKGHQLPGAISEIETAVPVFIGYTQKCEKNGQSLLTKRFNSIVVSEPVRILSLNEYENYFGQSANPEIEAIINEAENRTTNDAPEKTIRVNCTLLPIQKMYYHLQMYFANGGGKCFVVSVGDATAKTVRVENLLAGLESAGDCDEITLLVFPQTEQLAFDESAKLYQAVLKNAGELRDRFAILDCFNNEDSFSVRDVVGLRNLNFGAVYHPYLKTTLPVLFKESDVRIVYTLNGNVDRLKNSLDDLSPDLKQEVLSELKKMTIILPPSSAIAGIYVRNDAIRKVWTAPADVVVANVVRPTISMDGKGQAEHIADAVTGKSINVIRDIPNKGSVVIGARTLAGNDKDWKYISMRRLLITIESTIRKSVRNFSLESNNAKTWVEIQLLVENYLMSLWYKGVLQGADPDRAYFVKIGIGETMTKEDLREGRMVMEVGVAPVIPSEFLTMRIVQEMGGER